MGRASFTQCVKVSLLLGIGEQFTKKKKSYLGQTHLLLSLNLHGMPINLYISAWSQQKRESCLSKTF